MAPTCNKCIPLLSEVSIPNEAKLDCYVASFIGGWDCKKRTCLYACNAAQLSCVITCTSD